MDASWIAGMTSGRNEISEMFWKAMEAETRDSTKVPAWQLQGFALENQTVHGMKVKFQHASQSYRMPQL